MRGFKVFGRCRGHGRRARRVGIPIVVLLSVICVDAPAGAIDATERCYWLSGQVADGLGRGVAGATVSVTPGCRGDTPVDPSRATTASDGSYRVRLLGTLASFSVTATVTAAGFVTTEQTVSGLGSAEEHFRDFSLRFDPGAGLSPTALRSGGTVGLSARNVAPPPSGTGTGARVVADVPSGSILLDPGAPDADGFRTWAKDHAVTTGTPEGSYPVMICIVRESYSGSCAAASDSVLLGPLANLSYVVDDTPPLVDETYPDRFATVLSPQFFGVRWTDQRSGVGSNFTMTLDGSAVVPTLLDGGIVGLPASALAVGIHHVRMTATDRAGNVATDSFIFTRAQATAASTSASLRAATVPVTQTGPLSGKAVFSAAQADIAPFDITLSANTRVGVGDVSRDAQFGEATVVFNNGSTIERSVTVTPPQTTTRHTLAALAPEGGALGARLPASVSTLPTFEVEAPVGYSGSGSTARLVPKSVTVDAPLFVPDAAGFLSRSLDREVLVTGEIGACFDESSTDPGGLNCFPHGDTEQGLAEVTVRLAGNPVGAPIPLRAIGVPLDQDAESQWPACRDTTTGEGCQQGPEPHRAARVGLVFGCGDYTAGTVAFDLCTGDPPETGDEYASDGYFGAWLNAAVYETVDLTNPIWQQDHLDIDPAGEPCPNGGDGDVHASLYRGAATAFAYDGAAVTRHAGTAPHPNENGPVDVFLGYRTGTLPGEVEPDSLPGDNATNYQLSTNSPGLTVSPLTNGYGLSLGHHRDGFGRSVPIKTCGDSSNSWEADGAAGFDFAWDSPAVAKTGRIQLVAGADFAARADYQRATALSFQFVADFSECQA